jgi:hypothetical protein
LAAEAAQLLGDWNWDYSGDLDRATHWWGEAGRLAERSSHRHLHVRVADGQAARLTEERRYAEAIAVADHALERARAAGDVEGEGLLLVRKGYAQVCRGESVGIERMQEGARMLAEENSRAAAWAHIDVSLAHMMLGELATALNVCEEALVWAERFGEPQVIADAEARRAFLAYHAGDWQTAREIANRYIDAANRWSGAFVIWTHRLMAYSEGDDEAARTDDEAMRRFSDRVPSARALQSRTAAAAALAVGVETQGYRNWEIYAALELMAVPDEYEVIRELAARMPVDNPWRAALIAIADGSYGKVAGMLEEIGSAPLAARARILAAGEARSAGDHAGAERLARQALSFYDRVGATRDAEEATSLTHLEES